MLATGSLIARTSGPRSESWVTAMGVDLLPHDIADRTQTRRTGDLRIMRTCRLNSVERFQMNYEND